jgi:hypothetical protein
MEGDFRQVAEQLAARWENRSAPFPNVLQLLIGTYQHELSRRDLNQNGVIDEQEFVQSHSAVITAFASMRPQAERFIERAAGGFFDCLDLNRDGVLELADLELRLYHPMEADRDLAVRLVRTGEYQYTGTLPLALSGNWHWQLEPYSADTWRLNGRLTAVPPTLP